VREPLVIESPEGTVEVARADLVRFARPEATARAGRWGTQGDVVPVELVAGEVAPDVTHVTFHAADGYAATLPLEQALSDGVLVVSGAERVGVRLVVDGGGTTCLNVKAVTRVELRRGPGKHTIDPNPHQNAFVPGWDDAG
jgi:hypothetical protein